MSTPLAHAAPADSPTVAGEFRAGFAGTLISLAPVIVMGLLAFAALGPRGAALGIPAAFVAAIAGGALFAALSRSPMAAAGPSAAPVLVVGALVARVAADPAFSAADPAALAQLLALVALAVAAMGALQVVLGLSGLAGFAKFVPQPVLAGYVNGVSLLALLAIVPLLLGGRVGMPWFGEGGLFAAPLQPAALAVGGVTAALALGLPRLRRAWPRLPVTLISLAGGIGLYALLRPLVPPGTLSPPTGALPPAWPQPGVLGPWLEAGAQPLLLRHGAAALAAGVVMALIGTLELVLNSLALDQHCHTRTDPRREVMALGAANLASGVLGGLPLLLLRPRALHMIDAGARSRASLAVCCAGFAVLGIAATPWLALLPQVVLGAMMVGVYVASFDRWSWQLARQAWRGEARQADVLLALSVVGGVCAVTVLLGFPAAVALGALLSLVFFVGSMNRSLIRHRCTGDALPSRRIYARADEARLRGLRPQVTVLELEGALFFGSADRLAAAADTLDARCRVLLLDLRRVSLVDASGAVVLQQLARRLEERGIALLLAGVVAGSRPARALAPFVGEALVAALGVPDVDRGMERAELMLLARAGFEPLRETVPLEDVSLMRGLDAPQRARLAAVLQPRRLAAGELLFRQGDPGDRLYVITAGSVDVLAAVDPAAPTLRQRYVSLSPGMMLGETAMLDGGGRSGDAVAVGEVHLHELNRAALQRLEQEDAQLVAQVWRNVSLHLAERLRAAVWRAGGG